MTLQLSLLLQWLFGAGRGGPRLESCAQEAEAEAGDLHDVPGQPDTDREVTQGLLSAHDGLELVPS